MRNTLQMNVVALDPGFGYQLEVHLTVADAVQSIKEHYPTEALLRSRLATAFDTWAAQVDSE